MPWLRAYLKQKRIMGDRDYSWKEAQNILFDMDARGVYDEFFQSYFGYWGQHPEHLPAYFHLLNEVVPAVRKDGKFNLEILKSLDEEAKTRGEKILFNSSDVSIDIYNFYHDILEVPLNRDINGGTKGSRLLKYFEFEDFKEIPDNRIYSAEKVDEGERKIAVMLSQLLGKITPEKIHDDVIAALDHYDEAITQINAGSSFIRKFGNVQLEANPPYQSIKQDVLLTPGRSYGPIREGREGVFYPWFIVEKSID